MAPTSASSQGSGASTLPLSLWGSPASDRSSGTSPAAESSNDTGPTFPDGVTLLPTPSAEKTTPQRRADFTPNLPQRIHDLTLLHTPTSDASMRENRYAQGGANLGHDLTSLLGDSPASPSAPQDAARPRTITAGSGPSSPVSSATLDPDGSWLRTSPDSSVQATLLGPLLERFYGTWPRSGSMHAGTVYAHPTLERPTAEIDSSSLPTPRTWDAEYRGKGSTPQEAAGQTGRPLSSAVLDMLPTPRTTDGNGTGTLEPPMRRDGVSRRVERLRRADLLASPTSWLGRRPAHSKGDPKRWTNPERSNDLSGQIAFLGDLTNQPSEGGNE